MRNELAVPTIMKIVGTLEGRDDVTLEVVIVKKRVLDTNMCPGHQEGKHMYRAGHLHWQSSKRE